MAITQIVPTTTIQTAEQPGDRVVAAIQIEVTIAGGDTGHTWRWACTCGLISNCTFATAADADLYGALHTCRETAS